MPVQQSTRTAILEAARDAFLEFGYQGTSMEKVAKLANTARTTVYNQFSSKETLFQETVKFVWTDFPAITITQDKEALDDVEFGLTQLGRSVAEFWVPDTAVAFMRMVISEGPRFPGLAERFFEAGKAPALNAVAEYLSRMQGRGLKKVSDSHRAARQFLGLINEPLLWARVIGVESVPSEKIRQDAVAEAVKIFLAYYQA
ncbi:TetR/AcrR family transcriptional regulator [Candidatus Pantoea alvi]|nr:TetR/AcrR family transcriptional regulator [Pantoea alvi]UBN52402.1 TetR/AcrR family transcriptional regulator [Pantoea agglomerans]